MKKACLLMGNCSGPLIVQNMSKSTKAKQLFDQGYNCAQAVVSVFAGEMGIHRETAVRITAGFGGGMGRQQLTCGAVTGAYMVIGYLHGKHAPDDDMAKELTVELIQQFAKKFKDRHGHTDCRSLLGVDLNTEMGRKELKEKNLGDLKCKVFIEEIVEMLESEYIP